jgi:hypothetical protein
MASSITAIKAAFMKAAVPAGGIFRRLPLETTAPVAVTRHDGRPGGDPRPSKSPEQLVEIIIKKSACLRYCGLSWGFYGAIMTSKIFKYHVQRY